MKGKPLDAGEAAFRRRRRGAYRRRASRPLSVRARRAATVTIGPLDRLTRQTAYLILAGTSVGVMGREVFHAAAAASLASARSGRETALGGRMVREEFDLLGMPAVAEVYRGVGRDAWRLYQKLREQEVARQVQAELKASDSPATMH